MPITIEGVEKHVKKLYREKEAAMSLIEMQILAVLGPTASKDLIRDVENFGRTSQDLGSMRRLLGDLRAAAARKGTIDPR